MSYPSEMVGWLTNNMLSFKALGMPQSIRDILWTEKHYPGLVDDAMIDFWQTEERKPKQITDPDGRVLVES